MPANVKPAIQTAASVLAPAMRAIVKPAKAAPALPLVLPGNNVAAGPALNVVPAMIVQRARTAILEYAAATAAAVALSPARL